MSDGVEGDNCVELLTFCLLIKIEMERFSVIQKSDRRETRRGQPAGRESEESFRFTGPPQLRRAVKLTAEPLKV